MLWQLIEAVAQSGFSCDIFQVKETRLSVFFHAHRNEFGASITMASSKNAADSQSRMACLDSDDNEEEELMYEDIMDNDDLLDGGLGLELHPDNDLDLQAEP